MFSLRLISFRGHEGIMRGMISDACHNNETRETKQIGQYRFEFDSIKDDQYVCFVYTDDDDLAATANVSNLDT